MGGGGGEAALWGGEGVRQPCGGDVRGSPVILRGWVG